MIKYNLQYFGGRGASSSGAKGGAGVGGGLLFSPQNSDEISNKLNTADSFLFSRQTITMKNADGKTMGMVRGINRFSDLSGSRQFTAYQEIKKLGLDNSSISNSGISQKDIYINGKQVYVFNNTRTAKYLSNLTKENAKTMKSDIEKMKKKNKILSDAESKGAIIINY